MAGTLLGDMITGAATLMAGLVAGGAGLWQFSKQQAQKNKEPFLNRQMDTCFRAAEAAAHLAVETNEEKWKEFEHTFWLLYWGVLCIVEDDGVERAMVQLGDKIKDLPATKTLPLAILRGPSYELAHAIRQLILRSWNINDLGKSLKLRVELEHISSSSRNPKLSPPGASV